MAPSSKTPIPSEFVDYRVENDRAVLLRQHPVPALGRPDAGFEENRRLQLEESFSLRDLQDRIIQRLSVLAHNGHPFDIEVENRALCALKQQA